jgi:hypothetical protein
MRRELHGQGSCYSTCGAIILGEGWEAGVAFGQPGGEMPQVPGDPVGAGVGEESEGLLTLQLSFQAVSV